VCSGLCMSPPINAMICSSACSRKKKKPSVLGPNEKLGKQVFSLKVSTCMQPKFSA
jgi:hypothetical protein